MRVSIIPATERRGSELLCTFIVEAVDHHYRSVIKYDTKSGAKAAAERYATRLSQSEFYDFTPARRMEER